ncbi:ABC transporter permease [uncultured Clostridium sp.]|uniref:ABC transporter permease n=1 Tax=uncultured Clostridium sp. TaxID=59620 RepID=UPI0028E773CD|nr:ABC transporter permease [uncultured Clostridium sp.]
MWTIAYKNIKDMFKNIFLLGFLIIIPLFLIGIINSMAGTGGEMVNDHSNSIIEIVILSASKDNSSIQYFATTTLVLFTLLGSMIAASMLVGEREKNTLLRMFAAPIRRSEMLGGILIGHSLIVLLISSAIIILSNLIFGVNWGSSILNIIVVTIFGVYVATALAFIVSGVFKSTKVAGTVASFIVIFMTFASGGFTGGDGFGVISKFTINKWISDGYLKLMEGGDLNSIKINLIILGIMGTVFMIIASIIYRRENIYE